MIRTFDDFCDFLEDCIINNRINVSSDIIPFSVNTIRFQDNFSRLKNTDLKITGYIFDRSINTDK